MNDPEVIGRRAEQSNWLDYAARAGLVAYGVVYLLIAWVAVQLALGDHSQDASPNGALRELAQQPFGKFMVWAVALGMLRGAFSFFKTRYATNALAINKMEPRKNGAPEK